MCTTCLLMLQIGNHQSLVAQHHAVQDQKHEVKGRQDMMRGSLQTIRDGVHRAQRDLASPNYRDIDARYRKQLIELKTTEMANSDLDKYHKVWIGWNACGTTLCSFKAYSAVTYVCHSPMPVIATSLTLCAKCLMTVLQCTCILAITHLACIRAQLAMSCTASLQRFSCTVCTRPMTLPLQASICCASHIVLVRQ